MIRLRQLLSLIFMLVVFTGGYFLKYATGGGESVNLEGMRGINPEDIALPILVKFY